MRRLRWAPAVIAVLTAALPAEANAQAPGDTVVRAANARYAAGALQRALLGHDWRALWTEPVRVPVLDVRRFAGGLTPERRGGGNQSVTLHLVDAAGGDWIFRSIDKFPTQALGPAVEGTFVGRLIQDQISGLHPGGHFVLPVLLEAVGILHVMPTLYLLPDDEALGEFRAEFAGMLGELEQRANEGPDDSPGFAGSRAVKGTEEFLEDLEESAAHRVDEREFLRARLVDFVVGDPDRGTDQWRWARFDAASGYRWRPIPIDRDWAFVRADGLLPHLARGSYPKLTRFGRELPPIGELTFSTHVLDRRLLTGLTRADFAAEAEHVAAALTDAVIARAVAAMPPEYERLVGARMVDALRARRDALHDYALAFFALLATEVDVRGTDERDYARIERLADGSVLVQLWTLAAEVAAAGEATDTAVGVVTDVPVTPAAANGRPAAAEPYYERLFVPAQTREVRVHLHGGADRAIVTGEAHGRITIRVIGGGGDDLLEDAAGDARLYDQRGENRLHGTRGTRIDTKPWTPPEPPEGLRLGRAWAPDWGGSRGIGPAYGHDAGTGVSIGGRFTMRRYGFRSLPHRWRAALRVRVAPLDGAVGGDAAFDYRPPNSRRALTVEAKATQLESFRFYGFGNASPDAESAQRIHRMTRLMLEPALRWELGARAQDEAAPGDDAEGARGGDGALEGLRQPAEARLTGALRLGPVLAWTRSRAPRAAAAPGDPAFAADATIAQLGARAELQLARMDRPASPRSGFRANLHASGFPVVSGAAGAFARVGTEAAAYVPLFEAGPLLALRAGGERVFGDFPTFEAAFVGGSRSLRGLPSERLAGDASAYGSVELRVPLDTLKLLLRTELGVFAFGDAGRVWYQRASPGGLHTAWGGGFWLGAFARDVSVAVARASRDVRIYVRLGPPF